MTSATLTSWPITFDDVVSARARLAPHLAATAFRGYPLLDDAVGAGIRLLVKHENHQPTCSFKVRNGLSLMTALDAEERRRGVVAASTGNHGQGVAYGAALLGVDAIICVPRGNNPEKNAAMRAWGARVIEDGRDYDDALQAMLRIAQQEGRTIAHSTNDPRIIAGAGTMTLEMVDQAREGGDGMIDAIVLAIGGGSQAVGAMPVVRELAPHVQVFGVQAVGAAAQFDSWQARERRTTERADTFAEGVATRSTYDLTFPALLDGLAGFVTLTDGEIAEGVRLILATTHNLVEGAGAMGVMGTMKLRDQLRGKRVAVAFCGGNMDSAVLRRILNQEM